MKPPNGHGNVSILDIREEELSFSLLDDIHQLLRPGEGGEKRMPTMLLYDAKGLQLFEEITYLKEYYLTNAEIEVLENHSSEIAKLVPAGSLLLELGSGYVLASKSSHNPPPITMAVARGTPKIADHNCTRNLRKVDILLQAFEKASKEVQYYALDLSLSELSRTLSEIKHDDYKYVKCRGLHGTYNDGLAWLQRPENQSKPRVVIFLGSSLGNFTRTEASTFLKGFAKVLVNENDVMLIGLDACQNKERVYHGYNDSEGKTREFYLNGLTQANKLIGHEEFKEGLWNAVGEYDEIAGRHQAFYVPAKDVVIDGVQIRAGEKIRFEESYKYSKSQSAKLWHASGLAAQTVFQNSRDDYRK